MRKFLVWKDVEVVGVAGGGVVLVDGILCLVRWCESRLDLVFCVRATPHQSDPFTNTST